MGLFTLSIETENSLIVSGEKTEGRLVTLAKHKGDTVHAIYEVYVIFSMFPCKLFSFSL